MTVSRRQFLKLGGMATAAAVGVGAVSQIAAGGQAAQSAAAQPLAQDGLAHDEIYHLVNRLTWGVRPDELAHAQEIGYDAYLDEQLMPESLVDAAADQRLAAIPILNLSRRDAYFIAEREWRTYQALVRGMVVRAVHSTRQLHERMAEFWFDHFNIPVADYGPELIGYHRDVVRTHALGNFRDLLFGTAQHPAMLYYLDNYINYAEHPNENYARELMELHTLGVDGGYTETDVVEVARAFTGWTIQESRETGFYFEPDTHDTGEKQVLGHTLPADRGIEDGLHVLSILVAHPATARFICRKLCVRFVSDDPPESLIESAAAVWAETRGEIRPVLRHLFTSDEFKGSAAQKMRRPLEFFIAALRATGAEIREFWELDEMLESLAQPPYGWQPPNGYPDVAAAWTNTGSLLARWNTAMALTHETVSENESYRMRTPLFERIGEPTTIGALVDAVAVQVFGAALLPDASRAQYIAFVSDDDPNGETIPVTAHLRARKLPTLFGLMLASPQFQWR